jgi:hypothetical protein
MVNLPAKLALRAFSHVADARVAAPRAGTPRTTREGSSGAESALAERRALAVRFLLLAALWVAARPYFGIVHDARLYMVQALHALQPERFAGDLYFAFGSQDAFTAFSALDAPLIGAMGPSRRPIAWPRSLGTLAGPRA